jgi:hypothetical protein
VEQQEAAERCALATGDFLSAKIALFTQPFPQSLENPPPIRDTFFEAAKLCRERVPAENLRLKGLIRGRSPGKQPHQSNDFLSRQSLLPYRAVDCSVIAQQSTAAKDDTLSCRQGEVPGLLRRLDRVNCFSVGRSDADHCET